MLRRWQREPRVAGSCDPRVNPSCDDSRELPDDGRLRLLSFNIQVGISTERYRHYLTRGWQHLLPHAGRATNLKRIGELLADYDLVALQEADGGSLRSGYVNQVEHLAQIAECQRAAREQLTADLLRSIDREQVRHHGHD